MYIKTVKSILTFNILIISYFYWILVSFQMKGSKTSILVLSALALIISVSLAYFFLINEGIKKGKLIISQNKKAYLMFFVISAYSIVMISAFLFKPGGSQLVPIEIVCSLFAAIFVFLHPLKSKNTVLTFNVSVLIIQVIVLYKIIYNWYITNCIYFSITSFIAGTKTLAFFAIVSFAFSLLSCVFLSKNLFKHRSLTLVISLNIIVSVLISISTYARGAMASFAIMFVYLLCSTLFFKKSEASSILKLSISSMVILFCLFLLNKSLNLEVSNFFNSIYKFHIGFLDTSRFIMWKEGINQVTSRVDTFLFGEPKLFSTISYTYSWHLHNSYLEMIRCAGIFSVFFFLVGVYIAFSRKGFGFFKENIFATAVLIILLIQILFDDFFMGGNYHFLIFWAMLECCRSTNLKNDEEIR